MNLYYNGTDIYKDVSVNYCVHEMYAEKQADALVIRFNDVNGIWSKWNPSDGDTLRLKDGAGDTGKMFVHSLKPENGLYTLRALSIPKSAGTKHSKSWEGVRFLQVANEIAERHGLKFKNYGCPDQLYPYLVQNNLEDFVFFSRLCTREGCQMLVYDGNLMAYKESYIESQSAAATLEVNENGFFAYQDNRAEGFGSCEIASGNCFGKFTDPNATTSTVLRPNVPLLVTSNAEAARFAKGLLRDANKYGQTGKITKSLLKEYAAASIVNIKTQKASTWDGKAFVYKVIHDYVKNKTIMYVRKPLEGY